jgi:hypothetical protein
MGCIINTNLLFVDCNPHHVTYEELATEKKEITGDGSPAAREWAASLRHLYLPGKLKPFLPSAH